MYQNYLINLFDFIFFIKKIIGASAEVRVIFLPRIFLK